MNERIKTIGLVLESIGQERFYGYLAKVKSGIVLDEFSHLTLKQEVVKISFWCKRATGQYKTNTDILEDAIEVGRQLKCIGIDNPKLIYNDIEKPIIEWQI